MDVKPLKDRQSVSFRCNSASVIGASGAPFASFTCTTIGLAVDGGFDAGRRDVAAEGALDFRVDHRRDAVRDAEDVGAHKGLVREVRQSDATSDQCARDRIADGELRLNDRARPAACLDRHADGLIALMIDQHANVRDFSPVETRFGAQLQCGVDCAVVHAAARIRFVGEVLEVEATAEASAQDFGIE